MRYLVFALLFYSGPLLAQTLSVQLKRPAKALVMLLGDKCSCEGGLSAEGKVLLVDDLRQCRRDIRQIAINWNNETEWPITVIHERPDKIAGLRHKLVKTAGERVRFLSPQGPLPCLVFATDLQLQQEVFLLNEPAVKRQVRRLPDFPREKHQPDTGLYQERGRIHLQEGIPTM